jgi:hypothetical protein
MSLIQPPIQRRTTTNNNNNTKFLLAIVLIACLFGLIWGLDLMMKSNTTYNNDTPLIITTSTPITPLIIIDDEQPPISSSPPAPTTPQTVTNQPTIPPVILPMLLNKSTPSLLPLTYPQQKKWHNYDSFPPCPKQYPYFQLITKETVDNWEWNDNVGDSIPGNYFKPQQTWSPGDRCNAQFTMSQLQSLLNELKPYKSRDCIQRARSGEPILMQRLLQFALDWDSTGLAQGRLYTFFCDWIVEGPKSQLRHSWWKHISDVTINKNVPFDWEYLAKKINEKTPNRKHAVTIFFSRGLSFCTMLDLEKFNTFVNFPVIIIGPWGDGDNYGPFSSKGSKRGDEAELGGCKGLFETRFCGVGSWTRLVDFLEDPRVLLWISFSQTIDHPKIISVPLGIERRFFGYAKEEIPITLKANKTKLLAITFTDASYGMRNYWIHAVNENKRIQNKNLIEFSTINPWNKTLRALHDRELIRDAFIQSMHVYRNAKLVIAPAGFGQDTKRPFETWLMGSVPLMLRTSGLEKTYSGMPVVFIDNFDDLNALEERYVQVVCAAKEWKFEKLTWFGWLKFIYDVRIGVKTVMDWSSSRR